MPREEWRTKLLPDNLANAWGDPDALYSLIAQSLADDFVVDVADAARRLRELEPSGARSAVVLGIVELKLGRLGNAEQTLRAELEATGEDGVVLTNLAKVFAERGDARGAEDVLWRALQADPNQENALGWWMAIHRERGGEVAVNEALGRVAALSGSWRAQIWLARSALQRCDLDGAMSLYAASLASPELTGDALMQISGDLGSQGLLKQGVALVSPRYQPELHGLGAGNNLLKALFDLGDYAEARRLLQRLYECQRPDWRKTLTFWERELDDKADRREATERELTLSVLDLQGPVWAREAEDFSHLVPEKRNESPRVAVILPSCAVSDPGDRVVTRRSKMEGAFSRALALSLAEHVHWSSTALGVTLIPRLEGPGGSSGFALVGHPWQPETLLSSAVSGDGSPGLIANLHMDATISPWHVTMTVLTTPRLEEIRRLVVAVDPRNTDIGLPDLQTTLLEVVATLPGVARSRRPPWSMPPEGREHALWMAGTEQCLAVVCSSLSGDASSGLYGERSMIDDMISACVDSPGSEPWRMLLLTTLNRLAEIAPEVVGEYSSRLRWLQRDHPIRSKGSREIAALAERLLALRKLPHV